MLRVLIGLFWVSLLVGTLVARSVVAHWAVTRAALYFTAPSWAGRRRGGARCRPLGRVVALISVYAMPELDSGVLIGRNVHVQRVRLLTTSP